MDRRIVIEAGDIKGVAILAESDSAMAIWDSLPYLGRRGLLRHIHLPATG